jgi:thioredoxin 1
MQTTTRTILTFVSIGLLMLFAFCQKTKQKAESTQETETEETPSSIHGIASEDELNRLVEMAGQRLIAVDIYANWCIPCKRLSPILEQIAIANSSKVTFFRVNVEKLPDIARKFGVNGIPHVAFLKNKEVVETVVGMQPEETYIDIINRYSAK